MFGDIEDWKNGWYGVSLGLSKEEIRDLIGSLQALANDPERHFHINNESKEQKAGLDQVTIYAKDSEEPDNMELGSIACMPGEIIQEKDNK